MNERHTITDKYEYDMLVSAIRDALSPDSATHPLLITRIPLICKDIETIRKMLETIKESIVTQDQFWPVKTLVYGVVGTVLLSVLGAVLTLVVITHT